MIPEKNIITPLLGGACVVALPKIEDPRGNLTAIESQTHIPFLIARVYYLYDVPAGASRGGHAHRELEQVIVAAAGSFDVTLKDGKDAERVTLNRPYQGLYLPKMVWRDIDSFSSGAVCLVLASDHYLESDYFRDFAEFQAAALAS